MSATAVKMRRTRATACQRRNNKILPHRIEMLFVILSLIFVAILFTGYLKQSATFQVKRVLFEGAHILPETDILAAAGITSNDNIIFLDTFSTARRVEALPYVKRCEVKRMYPDEVLLRIIERKAVATVMVSNHLFEIDREYVVLRELSPKALPTGPMIT
ncbi:MAG TPA: FtsQ-type POTRA domain-containing protein, partial [Candidatus Hydrogenedentes bacterium]|nr:FtsQ-type POTRA domain-containing protein [Candidatus Hydrogenedentota bacterium]